MSSPKKDVEEPMGSDEVGSSQEEESGKATASAAEQRPPAKRRMSSAAVIEISDTESDDSDICAVTSYQASADEVKRIRGADYSSSSSSSSSDSYSSDSESPWEDDSIVLEDKRPLTKLVRAQLNPRADRTEDPHLNPKLKNKEVIDRLKTHWKEHKDLETDEVTLTCEPFRLCLLHDLLQNSDIVNNIVDDMNTLDWTRKKMDLYEFHQTVDLANLTWQRSIKGIYELLKNEVMTLVSEVTGVSLSSVSASCSLYGPGDHLLPHDDRMADRRLAFILYLAPWAPPPAASTASTPGPLHNGDGVHVEQIDVEWCGWSPSLGGSLELLATDAEGGAGAAVHRLAPRNNMLALFQVDQRSFHQVSEVVSLELPRLSINGWFHGAAPEPASEPEPAAEPPPPPPFPASLHNEVVLLDQWVEAAYMSPVNRGHIQQQMERESEVALRDFLQPDKLAELLQALEAPDVEWETAGPGTQRHYCRVAERWWRAQPRAHAARAALALWGSLPFARLLRDCTDLTLARADRLELQRWAPGDYTLLPPRSTYSGARLETVMYLGVSAGALAGGHTTFLAPEDDAAAAAAGGDAALVTVKPQNNALALVYCDAGAAAFTKYVSRLSRTRSDTAFYLLTCTYTE